MRRLETSEIASIVEDSFAVADVVESDGIGTFMSTGLGRSKEIKVAMDCMIFMNE